MGFDYQTGKYTSDAVETRVASFQISDIEKEGIVGAKWLELAERPS